MKMIYLAYPIDQADPSRFADELQWFLRQMSVRGLAVYEPGKAWFVPSGSPFDYRIQRVNDQALRRADVVVALIPRNTPSRGVWVELERALQLGIPTVVWSHDPPERSATTAYLADRAAGWHVARWDEMLQQLSTLARDGVPAPSAARAEYRLHDSYAVGPSRGHADDVGNDLYVTFGGEVPPGEVAKVPCHVSVRLPDGYWGLVHGRSSTWAKGLMVQTSVIDPGFRGPLYVDLLNVSRDQVSVEPGDRLAQLIPIPSPPPIDWYQVEEWEQTERGDGGYGSTGR
jgi:dUTP pyrophosphatase